MIDSNKKIHFIGICGVAMSALATAFHNDGWQVTGSDVGFFPPISDFLKDNNIQFYPGWHPEKMIANGTPDLVVVGNVAGSTNPEFLFVQKHNLNYKSYPEVIAEYIVEKNSLVCAGTYGKTSSATLLTLILKNAGMDPSYMFGGLSLNLAYSAKISTAVIPTEMEGSLNLQSIRDSSTPLRSAQNDRPDKWSVLEGDEYKTARWDNRPKFALYSTTHLLLTSVCWDHADVYPTEESYLQAFRELVGKIPNTGLVVACTDGANIETILSNNKNKAKIIKYGKTSDNDYYYHDLKQTKNGLEFKIKNNGTEYNIIAPVLGEHMAENICGSFAMAKEIGIEINTIIETIKQFTGVKRRLEKKYEGEIAVYDDLAHSPAKAAASLKTLRHIYPDNKIIAIFEPNTGNRKMQALPGYDNAFKDADEVIIPALTKLKTDPTDLEPPFDGEFLKNVIAKTHPHTNFIENDKTLIEYVRNESKKEDVVVFLGSHGFRGMIDSISLHQPPQP
jgi:UDP-N-acetylmuramate: L-alanyl-gamma-D-glutamyl-meso-diaminopimelate ligase